MLGLIGSLLGGVGSGVLSLFGQNSANQMSADLSANRYQTASADMTKAGLNPAAMFGSGSAAPMPVVGNPMAGAASAMKDAAGNAVQMQIADKTIEQLTSQIAKTNADAANVKAAFPSIASKSSLDSRGAGAVMAIPNKIYTPLVQAGFGADTMKNTGAIGSALGATSTSAKSIIDGVSSVAAPFIKGASGLSGPTWSSVSALKKSWDEKSPALLDQIWQHLQPDPPRNTTIAHKTSSSDFRTN